MVVFCPTCKTGYAKISSHYRLSPLCNRGNASNHLEKVDGVNCAEVPPQLPTCTMDVREFGQIYLSNEPYEEQDGDNIYDLPWDIEDTRDMFINDC